MPEAKHIARPTPYASSDDFCRIFNEDINGLYMLSFLLTADHGKAEQCFVSGLEDAIEGNAVFKEWARSWARRAIIQNAVRVINPLPAEGGGRSPSSSVSVNGSDKPLPAIQQVGIAYVLALEPFDRFVYVITVLERYSDQECSILLGCARRDVLVARLRALQLIASAAESHDKQLPSTRSQNPTLHERGRSVFELLTARRLESSA